jgi:hypothetical protein
VILEIKKWNARSFLAVSAQEIQAESGLDPLVPDLSNGLLGPMPSSSGVPSIAGKGAKLEKTADPAG